MVRTYLSKQNLAQYDVRIMYTPGDRVMHRQKRIGKLKSRAIGPLIFLDYCNATGLTARVKTLDGREFEASTANLAPMHLDTLPALAPEEPEIEVPGVSSDSESIGSDISDPPVLAGRGNYTMVIDPSQIRLSSDRS